MPLQQARIMRYLAAVFNFIAIALLHPACAITDRQGIRPVPADGLFGQVAWLAICAFGVGYWLVARKPERNRDLVKIGVLGKFGMVTLGKLMGGAGRQGSDSRCSA